MKVAQPWFEVESPRAGEPLEVIMPSAALPPGRYLLEVVTSSSAGPAQTEAFPFVLETASAAAAERKKHPPL